MERRHTCLRHGWIIGLLVGWSINGELARPEPTRILVKPREGIRHEELAGLHAKSGCRLHRRYPSIGGLEVVEVAAPAALEALLDRYRASALVEYCEPDAVVRAVYSPNDSRFTDGTLWSLHNTGQNGGVADGDIDAPEGWDIQRDASSIVVAVIDSGVRYTHQDLGGNMWQNAGEVPANRIDEDGNGYYNDIYGMDAIRQSGDPMDDHGHGTHVAGIIGAVGDNSAGCVGVAPRVRLMALKFLNPNLYGFVSDAIECIDYARAKGAKIINASWGDYADFTSVALRDAIARARDAGIIFVTAAGNDGYNNDVVEFYPANYDLDNIISVAATTRRDVLATWSHYGPSTVDLGAPGEDVYSTWADSNFSYNTISGTSMATPHVVGVCALVWARYPSLTYRQVIQRVLGSVDALPSLAGKTVTGGRVNLQRALLPMNSPPVMAAIGNKTADEGVQLSFTATASDVNGGALTFSLDAGAPVGATINPTTGVFSWTPGESHGGSALAVTIRVTDSASASDFETVTITVREVNAAPVLAAIGNKTVDEGVQLSFTATASDGDGGALTFSLDAGAPAGATINPTTGVFSWTPGESQGGSASAVTIRVTDGASASDFETITITVREVNAAPVLAAIGNKTVDEEVQLLFTATASDVDSGALTFSLDAGAPAGATINPTTGMFSWTPGESYGGSAIAVTIRVTDSALASDLETVTINVREVNVAPVLAAIGNKTVDEGAQLSFTAPASDADGGGLTFSLDAGAPAGAAINPVTGVFSWTPGDSYGGSAIAVTIRVTDSAAASDFETFTITVREVNAAPVLAAIGNKTVDEGVQLSFTATASDADGGALTFSLDAGAPAGATINPTTGMFSWTPDESYGGSAIAVTIRVTDSASASDFETITINVREVNLAPVLSAIGNKTADEGSQLSFTAPASDADGGGLTFSLDAGAPAGATINPITGVFSWTPGESYGGSANAVTIRVTDSASASDFETVTINVREANVAPVLSLIPNQTNSVGNTISFRATAMDADLPGNLLTFVLASGSPAGSAINAITGDFSWTPNDSQAPSTNVITVRVVDNGSPPLEDSQAVMIVVHEGLRITTARAVGANSVELTWTSIPGKTYQIQFRNNLQVTGWTIVGSAITANSWTTSATATAAGGRLFFRIVQLN